MERTTLHNPIYYAIKLAGLAHTFPQDEKSWPAEMNAGKLLGHHIIPKEDNSLVNNRELAVQENLTVARVSIEK